MKRLMLFFLLGYTVTGYALSDYAVSRYLSNASIATNYVGNKAATFCVNHRLGLPRTMINGGVGYLVPFFTSLSHKTQGITNNQVLWFSLGTATVFGGTALYLYHRLREDASPGSGGELVTG